MPTIQQIGLPIPATYSEFESIVCSYFSTMLGFQFTKWGRTGQKQNGIDLIGESIGVQCKNYKVTKLTSEKIEEDIKQVEEELPFVSKLYIVTTAPTDAVVQKYIYSRKGKILVDILYWDVIERFLLENPNIKDIYYPKEVEISETQLFVNKFLELCHKYNIYGILNTNYMVPYPEKIFVNNDYFNEDLTELINSNASINVEKIVLQEIEGFKNGLNYMIEIASIYGSPNGEGYSVPSFSRENKRKIEEFFSSISVGLIKSYNKYKFGVEN